MKLFILTIKKASHLVAAESADALNADLKKRGIKEKARPATDEESSGSTPHDLAEIPL